MFVFPCDVAANSGHGSVDRNVRGRFFGDGRKLCEQVEMLLGLLDGDGGGGRNNKKVSAQTQQL